MSGILDCPVRSCTVDIVARPAPAAPDDSAVSGDVLVPSGRQDDVFLLPQPTREFQVVTVTELRGRNSKPYTIVALLS